VSVIFSIIIPTYNVQKSIVRTLDSIIKQSLKSFEILIIDGRSTDNTIETVNHYLIKSGFTEFKIISENDTGIYDAMNKGISIATGNFIYFLGSDDLLYSSDVLELVNVNIKKFKDVEIFYGNVLRYDVTNKTKEKFVKTFTLYNNKLLNKLIIFFKLGLCHQTFFARRELFSTRFSLEYKLVSDLNWILDLVEDKKRFKHINITIAKYNISGTSSDLGLLFLELIAVFTAHYGITLGYIFRLLRKKRWMIAMQRTEMKKFQNNGI